MQLQVNKLKCVFRVPSFFVRFAAYNLTKLLFRIVLP